MKRNLIALAGMNAAVLAIGLMMGNRPSGPSSGYPQRPVELVVPFSHGGGTDTFARVIEFAIRENDLLPQPLTVINRGGAGATIGSRYVKNAEPDGYTLMVLHDAIITAKYSGMVDYGPESFEVIAGTGEQGMVIAVADESPYGSLEELLEAAVSRPGTIRFGANLGALTHFAGMQIEKEAPGAEFLYPQVGGGADRFGDLIGGHIDVTGFSIEEFHRFSSAGIRGLAFLGPQRHPSVPDLPTAIELGYDIVNTNMFFWWFPKRTPLEPIQVMREALRKAMETDYVRARLDEIQCEPLFLAGDPLRERLDSAERRLAGVVTRPQSVLLNLPTLLGAAAVFLMVVIGLQKWRHTGMPVSDPELVDGDPGWELSSKEQWRAVYCLGITMAYVLGMMAGVGFILATILYVLAVGSLLVPNARAIQVLVLLLIGQVLGFGLNVVFTRLFEVALP